MKYSQYDEEYILDLLFKNKKDGVVVDIGAADGVNNSNSRKLLLNDWFGVLVEPNKTNYEKLLNLYKNNNKVQIHNCGCSDKTETNISFFIDKNDEFEQLSTFSNEQVEKCKNIYNCEFVEQKIDIKKTSELFEISNLNKIDFLSIDTEAFDLNVIKGINFDQIEIDLICVEHTNDELISLLKINGFDIFYQNIGNTFFRKK